MKNEVKILLNYSKLVTPNSEIITEVKNLYNRTLNRYMNASEFFDNEKNNSEEKNLHIVSFYIEVVNVLENYLQVLKEWGINITAYEIMNGFIV